MSAVDERYAHLLQPIRDVAENFNIDLAHELEEYLSELESISISFDGGKTQLNFAEAALLIQGSAVIYSKKVEFLYSLLYQTLDVLIERRKANEDRVNGGADSGRRVVSLFQEPEFVALDDDIREGTNIDLDDGDDWLLADGSADDDGFNVPLPPASTAHTLTNRAALSFFAAARVASNADEGGKAAGGGSAGGKDKDKSIESKLSGYTIHASGALLLDANDRFELDREFRTVRAAASSSSSARAAPHSAMRPSASNRLGGSGLASALKSASTPHRGSVRIDEGAAGGGGGNAMDGAAEADAGGAASDAGAGGGYDGGDDYDFDVDIGGSASEMASAQKSDIGGGGVGGRARAAKEQAKAKAKAAADPWGELDQFDDALARPRPFKRSKAPAAARAAAASSSSSASSAVSSSLATPATDPTASYLLSALTPALDAFAIARSGHSKSATSSSTSSSSSAHSFTALAFAAAASSSLDHGAADPFFASAVVHASASARAGSSAASAPVPHALLAAIAGGADPRVPAHAEFARAYAAAVLARRAAALAARRQATIDARRRGKTSLNFDADADADADAGARGSGLTASALAALERDHDYDVGDDMGDFDVDIGGGAWQPLDNAHSVRFMWVE